MPPYNGITVTGAYITIITTVGNAENVSLEVNPGAVATIGDIQDLEKQIADLQGGEVTVPIVGNHFPVIGQVAPPPSTETVNRIKTCPRCFPGC